MFQQQNPQQPKSKMFKILCPIEKKSGGTYWTRCGTAYENRDESINCYLDFFPKDWKFQIRALDAEDLRRMNERTTSGGATSRNEAWRSATAPYARSAFNESSGAPPSSATDDDDDSMSPAALGVSSSRPLEDNPPF